MDYGIETLKKSGIYTLQKGDPRLHGVKAVIGGGGREQD